MTKTKKLILKLRHFYLNLSIRYKILLLNYCIVLFLSFILGTYSYVIYKKAIVKEIGTVNLRDTNQIRNNIDFLQNDVNELSTFICLSDDIQNFLKSNSNETYNTSNNQFSNINKYLDPLNNLLISKDYLSFISIYNQNGLKYYFSKDGSSGITDFETIKDSDIYEKITKLKGAPLWAPITHEKNNIFIVDNKNDKFAMFRIILDTNSYKPIGFMMICINTSSIVDMYSDILKAPGSAFILLDENNDILSIKESNFDLSKSSFLDSSIISNLNNKEDIKVSKFKKQEMLITHSTTKYNHWKVIYLVPMGHILKSVNSIVLMTIIILIICLIIGFLISAYTSSVLTKPIKKLLHSMAHVKKGNFKEKVKFIYKDEIGKLGNEYNDMIDHIHELINKVYKLQIQEKEAELRALQAQINPHFLYNTLDTIFWKAEKSKQKEISEMVYALSKLFRLTLNRGQDFISIQNEKELIECYFLLQKYRFKDRMDFNVLIDNSILVYTIPKLILQPFIENSVIHGTENSNKKTTILVKGTIIDENLHFSIIDNGVGMNNNTLKNLHSISSFDNSYNISSGYAIKNVKERLELYYDDQYRLNIVSKLNEGTRVEIIVPAFKFQ